MSINNKNTDQEKILSLFYSDAPANNLVGLEIIKTAPDIDIYIPVLIAIVLSSEDKDHAKTLIDFLKSRLTTPQIDYLQKTLENKYSRLYVNSVKTHFERTLAAGIIYAHYKRTGDTISDFLMIDQGEHPNREEVFNDFLAQVNDTPSWRSIKVPGLLPKEFDVFLEKVLSNTSNNTLILDSLKSPELPEILFNKKFKQVNISFSHSEPFFPDFIFRFQDVTKLSFPIDQHSQMPEDWSSLSSLEELHLNGNGHVFKAFDFINSLPKLKTLTINDHYLNDPTILLSKKKLPISQHIRFRNTGDYLSDRSGEIFILPQKDALAVGSALAKSVLSKDEQEYYFKKILKNSKIKNLETLPIDELMALMNINHTELRNVVNEQIETLSNKQISNNQKGLDSLDKKSLLYVAGTPGRKKTEIKQQLKDLKISLATKADEAITHLVICKNPKDYKQLQNRNVQLVSEQGLYQLFKKESPGSLEVAEQSGNTQVTENLLQFLYSDEASNIAVGLEILKTGGVPESMLDPLLVVYKCCPDTKMRGEAKKLLDRHAPAELMPLINDKQRFTNLNQRVKAQDINNKLAKIASSTSRQLAAKLALLLHGRYKKGLRYILYHFHEPSNERKQAFQAMMEGTHFDFSAGLGFTNNKNKNPEDIMLFKMSIDAKFPIDAIDNVPLIESANFHNCKINSLPKEIGNFKDLKELDLSHNFLKTIPKSIEEMTKLESLDLQMNSFKKFPMSLTRLKSLKYLDLRYNSVDYDFTPVEIPDKVRDALKGCEILV